jgi:hypothetical protein
LPNPIGRQAAVAAADPLAQDGTMTTQPTVQPLAPATPSLAKALAAIFLLTLAIGIASTYVLAAVRPSLFV